MTSVWKNTECSEVWELKIFSEKLFSQLNKSTFPEDLPSSTGISHSADTSQFGESSLPIRVGFQGSAPGPWLSVCMSSTQYPLFLLLFLPIQPSYLCCTSHSLACVIRWKKSRSLNTLGRISAWNHKNLDLHQGTRTSHSHLLWETLAPLKWNTMSHYKHYLFTESRNQLGSKRPLRSSRSTYLGLQSAFLHELATTKTNIIPAEGILPHYISPLKCFTILHSFLLQYQNNLRNS